MKFVAFLRNVNLGQPHSPTRAQLEAAFVQAGATTAASFMSNGTLVYSVSRSRLALLTARRAGEILRQVCGCQEPVFVCSFGHLAQLVAEDPFAQYTDPAISERCMSFFEPEAATNIQLPLESARKDCVVFRLGGGEALSVTCAVNGKIGYPTPLLEKALNVPVTTRSWTTILRLVDRHA
jgi:uncharacterized protein (DUF1697 family)